MSAFIVSHAHIDALVSFAAAHQASFWNPAAKTRITVTLHNAEEIGRMLLDENVRSVVHRYGRGDNEEKSAAAAYRFQPWRRQFKAVEIIKAVDCLEYQCCETDDWESSLAWRICQEIKSAAISALPGYENAAWEIMRPVGVSVES